MNVLDIFSGAGGISLGFKHAGFNIYGGIDFDQLAVSTFEHNFQPKFSHHGDISEVSDETIKKKLVGNIDIIVGGPPCQGFSTANVGNNYEDDPRNVLFKQFIRFVKIIKPKYFVMENVARILTKEDGEVKKEILKSFEKLGYRVDVEVLNASDFGVPQARRRAFFVGHLEGYNFSFENMEYSKKKVTVNDAISDLYGFDNITKVSTVDYVFQYDSKPLSSYQRLMRKESENLHNHNIKYPKEIVQQRMSYVKEGKNWKDVPEYLWDTYRTNRHSSAYRRLDRSTMSITIDTGHMNYFHPLYNRVPSVRESARIQSFDDSFVFLGNQGAQYRQVGNAVPPLLANAIAKTIKKAIEEKNENN